MVILLYSTELQGPATSAFSLYQSSAVSVVKEATEAHFWHRFYVPGIHFHFVSTKSWTDMF